jgi:hypothetical protein
VHGSGGFFGWSVAGSHHFDIQYSVVSAYFWFFAKGVLSQPFFVFALQVDAASV